MECYHAGAAQDDAFKTQTSVTENRATSQTGLKDAASLDGLRGSGQNQCNHELPDPMVELFGDCQVNPKSYDPIEKLLNFLNPSAEDATEDAAGQHVDSDTDSQAHLSDDEDIFIMRAAKSTAMPDMYR